MGQVWPQCGGGARGGGGIYSKAEVILSLCVQLLPPVTHEAKFANLGVGRDGPGGEDDRVPLLSCNPETLQLLL